MNKRCLSAAETSSRRSAARRALAKRFARLLAAPALALAGLFAASLPAAAQSPSGDQARVRPGDRDGVMTVRGTLTREGVECPALRSDNGRLYTLAGNIMPFKRGDRVVVRGRRAEISYCQQGVTISLRDIREAGR